ncbi:MAG TPA: sigma-70 family RNA polymerase sigma factor [Solirubrobacteraceae bacterium]|nr:sigma-70 family RNA polymerase sigma factor [Solirubrobacteraceae bacterium]
MSPFLLRRYRAERLLREEFETLRERVLAAVEGRLAGAGGRLDRSDLEAAYAQAWQGLYAAVLEGREIASPGAWLAVVTHRRAVDERRARRGVVPVPFGCEEEHSQLPGREPDLIDRLDDRARMRTLLEALRARLSERERQAAALCYLQGLSRSEAAAQMGMSESRMRKLMEGRGNGLRGVAAKVRALARAIADGEWCDEQGSLMRGLAFGILDPGGDRYRLAVSHTEQCPACRAYVLSLRGLALALAPVPGLIGPLSGASAAGAGAAAWAGAGHAGSAASAGTAGGPAAAGAATAAPTGISSGSLGTGLGTGALSVSGAAGAGAAGGGWWLAGGVGAKLAVGCLLALGVGAGCIALDAHSPRARRASDAAAGRAAARSRHGSSIVLSRAGAAPALAWSHAGEPTGARAPLAGDGHLASAARASREFGPEQRSSGTAGRTRSSAARAAPVSPAASAASTRPKSAVATTASPTRAPSGPSTTAAAREFAPG